MPMMLPILAGVLLRLSAVPTFTLSPSTITGNDKGTGGTTTVVVGCNANDVGQSCASAAVTVTGTSVSGVSVAMPAGAVTYTISGPGVTTVAVIITDNAGEVSAPRTLTFNIGSINDPPVVTMGGTMCARNAATPCGAAPTIKEDAGAQTVTGFFRFDTDDPLVTPLQSVASKTITCTPNAYSCTGDPSCGTALFTAPPSITGCTTAGTVQTCNLQYTVAPDEFTEGLSPGEVTCTVDVRDSGGTAACGGTPNCDTTEASFTVKVTPVNDPPDFAITPGYNIDIVEDCACAWPAWCSGAAPQQQATNIFSTPMSAGKYNEIVQPPGQVVTVKSVTVNDPSAFETLPAGSNLNANGQPTGNEIHVDDMGNVFFTPAKDRTGVFTVTVVVEDDGEVPCTTPCTNPRGPDNQPLQATSQTFTITIEEVNDPPFVELSTRVINVDEDCGPQDFNEFIMEITSGQGRYAPLPHLYPTPDERPQIVVLQDPTGPCPAGFMCASKLELIPPEAEALFKAVPVLDNTGPFTNLMRNTANLQFECAADRSTTHYNHVPCGMLPPNWAQNGVPNPTTPNYWTPPTTPTLPNSPTGSVRVRMNFQDNAGLSLGGCGQDASFIEFDIVIHEKNDPPSYTLRPMPTLTIFEDSYGVDPGNGLQCKPPTDTDRHPCGPEEPKELKIDNWLANFTTGNFFEDQFEKLTWLFTTDHGEYFYDGPKIDQYQCPFVDDMKSLRMTLEPHATGVATVYVDCVDSGILPIKCGEELFRIEILAINDPPDACPAMNSVTYNECDLTTGCVYEERWLRNINPGGGADERQQTVSAICNWGPKGTTAADRERELFEGQVALDIHTGDIKFTLKEYAQGTGWIDCTLRDDGGVGPTLTVNGTHCDLDEWSFRLGVTVNPINNPPTFDFGTATHGMDLVLEEDTPMQTILGFATKVSPSFDPQERTQSIAFTCVADDPSFFTTQPSISLSAGSTEGDLTLEPTPNVYGTTVVRCVLKDDGSCTNKDCDTEGSFSVTILPVNDRPVLTVPNKVVRVYSGSAGVLRGVIAADPGPNEDDQVMTYTTKLLGSGSSLFVQPPEILADGSLQYAAAHNVNGTVEVQIVGTDNGGGNNDTSLPVQLTIIVIPVNEPPTFSLTTRDVYLLLNSLVTETPVAHDIDADGDDYHFELSGYDTTLFKMPLSMSLDGLLKSEPQAVGVTSVTLRAVDHGRHCDPTNNTCRDVGVSPTQDFVIQVVNVLPLRFIKGDNVNISEDAGRWSQLKWATGIASSDPLANLSFTVDEYDAKLFTEGIQLTPKGELSFQTAENVNGVIPFRVCLTDGVAQTCKSARVTVAPVNDPPSFTLLKKEIIVAQDSQANHVEWVLTELLAGPPDESGQDISVTAEVSPDCMIFSEAPVFTTQNVLKFAVNQQGSCPVIVKATDELGLSHESTLTIKVDAVAQKPSFTPGGDVVVRAGEEYVTKWATDITGTDLEGFTVTTTNAAGLLEEPLTVSPDGVLQVKPLNAVEGTLTAYVVLRSTTGTSNTVEVKVTIIAKDSYVPLYWEVMPSIDTQEDGGSVIINNFCKVGNVTPGYSTKLAIAPTTSTTFKAQPVVTVSASECTLHFEPTKDFYGDIPLSLELTDTRSILQGSTVLRVAPVNDAPSFSVPEENRLLHFTTAAFDTVVPLFVKDISPGPVNEQGQSVTMSAVQLADFLPKNPSIDAGGNLRISIPAKVGTTVLHVKAVDNGEPQMQSVATEVVHIAVSTDTLEVRVGVDGTRTPLQIREDVALLLNVPVSRVAVQDVSSSGAVVSFVEAKQAGQPSSKVLQATLLATPGSKLATAHITSVPTSVGTPQPSSTKPPSSESSGTNGGSSLSPLLIGILIAGGVLLCAVTAELVRRHLITKESPKDSEAVHGDSSASPDLSVSQSPSSLTNLQTTVESNPIDSVFVREGQQN